MQKTSFIFCIKAVNKTLKIDLVSHERECSEDIRSRIACQAITQFEEKKDIKLNNLMSKKLSKRTSIFNSFRRKNKCDKHNKRRDFAEILSFIYTIFVLQCKSAKYMRATKKKDNNNRLRK